MPANALDFTPPDADHPAPQSPRFACVLNAWHAHEAELLGYLSRQLQDHSHAQDVLQEVFLKSMRAGQGFCTLDNPRAWLYRVAKTTLVDHARSTKPFVELPDDLVAPSDQRPAVDALDACLTLNLARLIDADRAIVQACDLQGQTVRDFAQTHGLTLSAAKSRLLRARQRLRQHLVANCGVQFDTRGQVCCHVALGAA